jgi:predicted CoA-substrate-specific enzyme activase
MSTPDITVKRTALFCGVDVGASATKLVLADAQGHVVSGAVLASGVDYEATARQCLDRALQEAGAAESELISTLSTGYGRHNVGFADSSLTELQCHGTGCYHHFPEAITVVDIGGQDNKVIRLDADGKRVDFKMNRKCAAGTGAFIEEIALRLDLPVEKMDPLAASTEQSVQLSSFCTVFAKTEILSHLRRGVPVAEIVRGAFRSVILRVVEMDPLDGEVVLTGGVAAHNPTLAKLLEEKLGRAVRVPPLAQFTGALGAALLAARQAAGG